VINKLNTIKTLQKKCEESIYECPIVILITDCLRCIIDISDVYYNCYVKMNYKDLIGDINRFNNIEFPQLKSRPVDIEDFYSSPIKSDI
jgi:hypothetical protein